MSDQQLHPPRSGPSRAIDIGRTSTSSPSPTRPGRLVARDDRFPPTLSPGALFSDARQLPVQSSAPVTIASDGTGSRFDRRHESVRHPRARSPAPTTKDNAGSLVQEGAVHAPER